MSTQQNMEERLWSFIDGTLLAEEKKVIEKLLENDTAWKAKYHELRRINELISASELDSPSMRFSKNVMEEIVKLHISPATKTYINKKIIWGLSFFFIVLIIGFLIYGFGQVDWNAEGNNNYSIDFSKVDISKFFSNTYVNIFMMINVILGLFLFDRLLAVKRKQFNKEA